MTCASVRAFSRHSVGGRYQFLDHHILDPHKRRPVKSEIPTYRSQHAAAKSRHIGRPLSVLSIAFPSDCMSISKCNARALVPQLRCLYVQLPCGSGKCVSSPRAMVRRRQVLDDGGILAMIAREAVRRRLRSEEPNVGRGRRCYNIERLMLWLTAPGKRRGRQARLYLMWARSSLIWHEDYLSVAGGITARSCHDGPGEGASASQAHRGMVRNMERWGEDGSCLQQQRSRTSLRR